MKVKELIAILSKFDPEATVMTKGYEYGWHRPAPQAIESVPKMQVEWDDTYYEEDEAPAIENVVLITRESIEEDEAGYGGKWEPLW